MRSFRTQGRWKLPLGLLCATGLLLLAACSGHYPQSTLSPKGDFSESLDRVFMETVYLATGIFILVEGALLYAIFKFRGKPEDAEPEQIHGNALVEVIWTVIPAVVLAIVAVPTVKTIWATAKVPDSSPDGKAPLRVEVIGHQWWWEFRYPELGIITANELHVPVHRTIDLRLKSVDVIHSFWVPVFSGKRDLFPNRETRLWFTADTTGAYPGACAEFCGTQHGRMDYYLMVDSPADFDAWVARRHADSALAMTGLPQPRAAGDTTTLPPEDSLVTLGRQLFQSKGCIACHTSNSTNPAPMLGPNLSGVGTRTMIAAGWLANTDENLARWVHDPQGVKEGVAMKLPVPVSEADARALVAYLRTKR